MANIFVMEELGRLYKRNCCESKHALKLDLMQAYDSSIRDFRLVL